MPQTTKLTHGGRIVIPVDIRRAMNIKEGDPLVMHLEDGKLYLTSRRACLRHAQDLVRQYIPEGVSLVEDLSAERRAEAVNE